MGPSMQREESRAKHLVKYNYYALRVVVEWISLAEFM